MGTYCTIFVTNSASFPAENNMLAELWGGEDLRIRLHMVFD